MFEFVDNIVVGIGIGTGWLLFAMLVLFLLVNKTPILMARKLVKVVGTNLDNLLILAENADVDALVQVIEDQKYIAQGARFGQQPTPEVKENINKALNQAVQKKSK